MQELMAKTPVDTELVRRKIAEHGLENLGQASIREMCRLIDEIQAASGVRFLRMEMGIPGLQPSRFGVEAEIEALRAGVACCYPSIEGLSDLKSEGSRFIKAFLNVDIEPRGCLPCTGSTNGSFLAFMVVGRMARERDTTLFLDPGFPVHKIQVKSLGLKQTSLDIYDHRGEDLERQLEPIFQQGNVSTVLYSNPNNPSWICLSERELEIIGRLCTRYNVIALEDLAYMAMDFRTDYSVPGEPPFQPSIAHYTDNYILLLSSSKIFSYAGQRIGLVGISNKLFDRCGKDLRRFFNTDRLGHAFIFAAAYAVSAGVNRCSQHGLASSLKAASDGRYRFLDEVKVYRDRARGMKRIFTRNGSFA